MSEAFDGGSLGASRSATGISMSMVPTLCGPVYSGNAGTTLILEMYEDSLFAAETGGVDASRFVAAMVSAQLGPHRPKRLNWIED